MLEEKNLLTGQLKYRDMDFAFVFNGEELRMIPSCDKKEEIDYEWFKAQLCMGVYMDEQSKMKESYLIGKCNENRHTIIFITQKGASIRRFNSILCIKILAYVDCKYEREKIDRITFSCPEIDCIYPVKQGYTYSFEHESFSKQGIVSITTNDFDSTTTDKQLFKVEDKDVYVQFCISRSISQKVGEPPISLNSTMMFEFEPTTNYDFVMQLWNIAKQFIRFLCYRRDVYIPTADLSAPYSDGMHEKFATLIVLNEQGNVDIERLKKGRYIKQAYIAGSEGRILSDISAKLLYERHLPDSYIAGRRINEARFVMITAAFEWEFRRLYPNGIPKRKKTLEVETTAYNTIQELIDNSTGKLKDKYKFLQGLIGVDSLEAEIIKIGKDYDDVIGVFGKHLYSLNGEKLKYPEMGQRLSKQRNNFAHGNLDKEFIGNSLLDLVYMEYIIYAMQLRYYGVDDDNIRKSINDLFGLNYAI